MNYNINSENLTKITEIINESMLINQSGDIIPTTKFEQALKDMTTKISREHVAYENNYQDTINFKTSLTSGKPEGGIVAFSGTFAEINAEIIMNNTMAFALTVSSPNLSFLNASGNCFFYTSNNLTLHYRAQNGTGVGFTINNNGVMTTINLTNWIGCALTRNAQGEIKFYVDQIEYAIAGGNTPTAPTEVKLFHPIINQILAGGVGYAYYERYLTQEELIQVGSAVIPFPVDDGHSVKYIEVIPNAPEQEAKRVRLCGTALADLLLEKGIITQAERDEL